jgi:hypothetical protein
MEQRHFSSECSLWIEWVAGWRWPGRLGRSSAAPLQVVAERACSFGTLTVFRALLSPPFGRIRSSARPLLAMLACPWVRPSCPRETTSVQRNRPPVRKVCQVGSDEGAVPFDGPMGAVRRRRVCRFADADPGMARQIAGRVPTALRAGQEQPPLSVSIGISVFLDDGRNAPGASGGSGPGTVPAQAGGVEPSCFGASQVNAAPRKRRYVDMCAGTRDSCRVLQCDRSIPGGKLP